MFLEHIKKETIASFLAHDWFKNNVDSLYPSEEKEEEPVSAPEDDVGAEEEEFVFDPLQAAQAVYHTLLTEDSTLQETWQSYATSDSIYTHYMRMNLHYYFQKGRPRLPTP